MYFSRNCKHVAVVPLIALALLALLYWPEWAGRWLELPLPGLHGIRPFARISKTGLVLGRLTNARPALSNSTFAAGDVPPAWACSYFEPAEYLPRWRRAGFIFVSLPITVGRVRPEGIFLPPEDPLAKLAEAE
jgi:hypothetical protein